MAAVHLNNETFRQLISGEKPALVEFWAPWCHHCVKLESAFEEIAAAYGQRLAVGKINIDDHKDLARQFKVMAIPTILVFKNGEEVNRSVGPETKDEVLELIK